MSGGDHGGALSSLLAGSYRPVKKYGCPSAVGLHYRGGCPARNPQVKGLIIDMIWNQKTPREPGNIPQCQQHVALAFRKRGDEVEVLKTRHWGPLVLLLATPSSF